MKRRRGRKGGLEEKSFSREKLKRKVLGYLREGNGENLKQSKLLPLELAEDEKKKKKKNERNHRRIPKQLSSTAVAACGRCLERKESNSSRRKKNLKEGKAKKNETWL